MLFLHFSNNVGWVTSLSLAKAVILNHPCFLQFQKCYAPLLCFPQLQLSPLNANVLSAVALITLAHQCVFSKGYSCLFIFNCFSIITLCTSYYKAFFKLEQKLNIKKNYIKLSKKSSNYRLGYIFS